MSEYERELVKEIRKEVEDQGDMARVIHLCGVLLTKSKPELPKTVTFTKEQGKLSEITPE